MISFAHHDKSFSLGPKTIIEDNPFFKNLEEAATAGDNKNNNYKNKLLNIDGVLHSIRETPTTASRHYNHLDEGGFLNYRCTK